ncbi:DUF6950 family protein [Pseudoroseomonas cervicalis]|uniref:DUF6950 family protein n=1 Tax=Teichococcus cervicalis TaxID=204525 RepID=UPI002784BE68|nr:hypothetical protein [Pseudoroseomonas cervicalis]MDQ1081454.1 hypothetical protein [Pseudoroseomonas cervicalis]
MTRPMPTRPRVQDWPERLAELIEARREMPFTWGLHDCCTFAADAAVALTGSDPMAQFRGRYSDEEGAAAMVGQGGLEEKVAAELAAWGAREIRPAFAQRGDWALVMVGNDLMSGVVIGAEVAVPGPDGLRFVSLQAARRCWGI